jgi:hypothetical protein
MLDLSHTFNGTARGSAYGVLVHAEDNAAHRWQSIVLLHRLNELRGAPQSMGITQLTLLVTGSLTLPGKVQADWQGLVRSVAPLLRPIAISIALPDTPYHREYPIWRRTTALCHFLSTATFNVRFGARPLLYLEVDVVPVSLMPNLLAIRGCVAIAREYDYMRGYTESARFHMAIDRIFPNRTWAADHLQLIGPSVLLMKAADFRQLFEVNGRMLRRITVDLDARDFFGDHRDMWSLVFAAAEARWP